MTGLSMVSELLSANNYEKWSIQMKTYFYSQELWGVVEAIEPDITTLSETENKDWSKKNALALHAIQISCGQEAFREIKKINSASKAWITLDRFFGDTSGGNGMVRELLSAYNYMEWRFHMKAYLYDENLLDIVEAIEPDLTKLSETEKKEWRKKNALALHAIQISCGPEAFRKIQEITSARKAWTELARFFEDTTAENSNVELFKAVDCGDWDKAAKFLDEHPGAASIVAPGFGMNALHFAITLGKLRINMVENLIQRMSIEEIAIKREDGLTSLAAAIEVGNLNIAVLLLNKNPRLIAEVHEVHGLPVMHAVVTGQKHMVHYLYSKTRLVALTSPSKERPGASLFYQCISVQHFDIARDMVTKDRSLAVTSDKYGNFPFVALANSKALLGEYSLKVWQRRIYKYIPISPMMIRDNSRDVMSSSDMQTVGENGNNETLGKTYISRILMRCKKDIDVKGMREIKVKKTQSLELLESMCEIIKKKYDTKTLKAAGLHDAIIAAIGAGNSEFISSMKKAEPTLFWNTNLVRRVIELAVEHRQAKIFSLIYAREDKMAIVNYCDQNGNNMLHKVAAVAPPTVLKRIPGAALQMQRELQWFKAVEEIASQAARETKNEKNLKPRALFTEEHEHLLAEGEKWLKDTSISCSLVGALIFTVTFAAGFTFPGGNDQNNGYPMFLDKQSFKLFMILNAVALFSSIISVMTFLGILISHYREEDFLRSLPTKLMIGQLSLFSSVGTMILAFGVGIFVIFPESLWLVIPSVCFAILSFYFRQIRVHHYIIIPTYGSSIFDKNVKNWIETDST